MTKKPSIELVKLKGYSKVIQINVPIRYRWDKNGSYDGIEVGPFSSYTSLESRLVNQILQLHSTLPKATNKK